MNNLQKAGGIAALINAAAYIVGFSLALTLLAPILDSNPEQRIRFLVENQTLMASWHIIIYLVAGVFMVPMVLGLYERLQDGPSVVVQSAAAFGLIWAGLVIASGMLLVNDAGVIAEIYARDTAQATTVWLALSTVESGLGGAIELPGGIWVLLVSWAGLTTGALPKALNYLGLVVGIAGIITVAPPLYEAGSIFGLGCIVWFVGVGVVMVRSRTRSAETDSPQTAVKALG